MPKVASDCPKKLQPLKHREICAYQKSSLEIEFCGKSGEKNSFMKTDEQSFDVNRLSDSVEWGGRAYHIKEFQQM